MGWGETIKEEKIKREKVQIHSILTLKGIVNFIVCPLIHIDILFLRLTGNPPASA